MIFILELYAALLGILTLPRLFGTPREGMNVICFIDNNAALASLLRGYTRGPIATRAIQKFWMAVSDFNGQVWLERVGPKKNFADAPSRFSLAPGSMCDDVPSPLC